MRIVTLYRRLFQLLAGLDGNCRVLLALTDICLVSCEQRIIGDVVRYLATLEEEPDEAEETAFVDGLYESVTTRFQRCASCCSISTCTGSSRS